MQSSAFVSGSPVVPFGPSKIFSRLYFHISTSVPFKSPSVILSGYFPSGFSFPCWICFELKFFFHSYFSWSLWTYLCTLLFWGTSWVSGNTDADEEAQRCNCFSEDLPNVLEESLSSPPVWNRSLFLHSGSRGKPLSIMPPEVKNTSDFYFPNLFSLRLWS